MSDQRPSSFSGVAHRIATRPDAFAGIPRRTITVNPDRPTIWDILSNSNERWMATAVCAQTDPEMFFPEKGGSTREAKRVCYGCDVRADCLEYALNHQERFGIWGGYSERERRKLARNPRRTAFILSVMRGIIPTTDPPDPGEPQPEESKMPNPPSNYIVRDGRSVPLRTELGDLALLLEDTVNHHDPLVRTIRKIVVQAGLALKTAAGGNHAKQPEPLPTSDPSETPTDSHDDETSPDVEASKPPAPPLGSEPSKVHGSRPGERAVPDPGAVREWAANHDIDCNRVGPIPRRVRMLYEDAMTRAQLKRAEAGRTP